MGKLCPLTSTKNILLWHKVYVPRIAKPGSSLVQKLPYSLSRNSQHHLLLAAGDSKALGERWYIRHLENRRTFSQWGSHWLGMHWSSLLSWWCQALGDVAPQDLAATAGRVALEPQGGTKKEREELGGVWLSAAHSSGCWHPVVLVQCCWEHVLDAVLQHCVLPDTPLALGCAALFCIGGAVGFWHSEWSC